MAFNQFNIASYNLQGLNSGISLLLDFCTKFHIIAIQELWQLPQIYTNLISCIQTLTASVRLVWTYLLNLKY